MKSRSSRRTTLRGVGSPTKNESSECDLGLGTSHRASPPTHANAIFIGPLSAATTRQRMSKVWQENRHGFVSCKNDRVAEDKWRTAHLLREPSKTGKDLARVRSLLIDIMTFTTAANGSETMWRGHRSSDHKLCPSIARGSGRILDQAQVTQQTEDVLSDAETASHYWRDGHYFRSLDELERLALIQHRITGTPLLDITPDPLVALWMACQHDRDSTVSDDGLLMGLNNWGDTWKEYTSKSIKYRDAITELTRPHTKVRVGWFRPVSSSDRSVVQRSRFLLAPMAKLDGKPPWYRGISDVVIPTRPSGWAQEKLDRVFDPSPGQPAKVPLVGFLIPAGLKQATLDVLRANFGIERNTVYPDIEALGS